MPVLVSIIIPVYNMEDSIENSVMSILKQDYKNIEVILVDDGSQDNSYGICKRIAATDSRVICIHTENQGSGPARNIGIAASRGKYLYFPDADDYLEQNALSILVNAMSQGKYDLIVFGYRCLTHKGNIKFEKRYSNHENSGSAIRKNYSEYFLMSHRFGIQGAPWNKFFDGDVIRENNVLYPALRRHQDEGFISRYVSHCKKVRFIDEVLYSYYQNTVSQEWDKYPVDYIDSVLGLNAIWENTICKWNKADYKTQNFVKKEIFTKLIKALELSYSPKMGLNTFSRRRWISNACKKAKINYFRFEITGSLYQKLVLLFAKLHLYVLLLLILYIGKIKNEIRQGK